MMVSEPCDDFVDRGNICNDGMWMNKSANINSATYAPPNVQEKPRLAFIDQNCDKGQNSKWTWTSVSSHWCSLKAVPL